MSVWVALKMGVQFNTILDNVEFLWYSGTFTSTVDDKTRLHHLTSMVVSLLELEKRSSVYTVVFR